MLFGIPIIWIIYALAAIALAWLTLWWYGASAKTKSALKAAEALIKEIEAKAKEGEKIDSSYKSKLKVSIKELETERAKSTRRPVRKALEKVIERLKELDDAIP